MAANKLKLTWDKAGARWRKIYKGKVWYGKRGVKKSDDESYRQAVDDYETWRGGIDTQIDEAKPNAKEYERAIFVRGEMIKVCLLEGNQELHDRYVKEIVTIRKNLAKKNPPKLNTIVLPLSSGMKMEEYLEWREKVGALRQHDIWAGGREGEKTLSALIDKHFQARLGRRPIGPD